MCVRAQPHRRLCVPQIGAHSVLGRYSLPVFEGERHLCERRLLLPRFHGERMRAYGEAMQAVTRA